MDVYNRCIISPSGRGVVEFCPEAPYQYAMDYRNTAFTPSYAPIRRLGKTRMYIPTIRMAWH